MLRMSHPRAARPQAAHRADRVRRRHRRRLRRRARSSSRTRSTPRSPTSSSASSRGVDVDVTAKQVVEGDFGGRIQPLPDGTLEKVRGASTASPPPQGNLEAEVAIFDEDRERVGGNGPPTMLFSHGQERFDPYTYVEGGPAEAPGEMTMDQATADKGDWEVGDEVLVAGRAEAKPYRVVGIGKIGDQDSLGIGSLTMPLSEVQQIAQMPGKITEVVVAAEDGTTPEQLKQRIVQALGDTAVVRTGKEQAEETGRRHQRVARLPHHALLIFAGIAVFVGGFLIFNTFAVTVAQRSREFALLRTLGASRRQVLAPWSPRRWSSASWPRVLGILGGLLLAPGLRGLLASFGLDLPSTGTVVEARTIIVGLRRRHDRDGRLRLRPGAPRDARGAARGDARGRDARARAASAGGALIASAVVIALGLLALLLGLFGGLERRQRRRPDRPRHGRDGPRRRAARAGARAPAGALHRAAAGALPGHARPAGARERRAPAAAHRDHRLGADDRARARRLHGDLRRRAHRVDRQGDRRAAQPQLADRHPRRRLLAGAGGGRRGAARRSRASTPSRRCASTRPT